MYYVLRARLYNVLTTVWRCLRILKFFLVSDRVVIGQHTNCILG